MTISRLIKVSFNGLLHDLTKKGISC